jgi:hypothetical protein
MLFLKLKRSALVTLNSASGGMPGGASASLSIQRDAGVSVVSVIRNFCGVPVKRPTHFLHYEHICGGQQRQDLWVAECDMPDEDGEHFTCPICRLPALSVRTVPQQPSEVLIGGMVWPQRGLILP